MTNIVADIYQNNALVAHFTRSGENCALEFISPDSGTFFTTTIPFGIKQAFPADQPPKYFLNLLPEGIRLEHYLQASTKLAKDDILNLIIRLGKNTIGDIEIIPHNESVYSKSNVEKFDTFREIYHDLYGNANETTAIAGVQKKISDVSIHLISPRSPDSIIKLQPEHYPHLLQNEHFFLRMAKACGIPVPQSQLIKDAENELGLLIRRFDRVKAKGEVIKLHQEDMCQINNASPAQKYHITMNQVVEGINNYTSSPKNEILRLLQYLAFSYLIGNADHHAKNISLLWNSNQSVTLSPAYDLICTLPYSQLDRYMVIPLQGKNKNFKAATFIATGNQYGIPERATQTMLQKLTKEAEPWVAKLNELPYEEKTIVFLQAEIESRRRAITPD